MGGNRVFFIATIIVLSSCGSIPNVEPLTPVARCAFPSSNDLAPMWVCGETLEGVELSAVGLAIEPVVGLGSMKQIAAADARMRLAAVVTLAVQNMIQQHIDTMAIENPKALDTINISISKFITDEMLIGARILKSRIAPSGAIYVLIGLDRSSVKYIARYALRNSMLSSHLAWQQLQIGTIQNSLAETIVMQ